MAIDDNFPSGSAELREKFLRDLRLAAIETGIIAEPPTQPGTDWYLLAEADSRLALVGLAGLSSADQDRSVLTATGSALKDLRDAYGLPEVPAAGATGKIVPTIFGLTTILSGTQFVYPNGFRGEVVGVYVNPTQGDEIDVRAIDVGSGTNLPGGSVVRFVSPPTNVAVEAKVSAGAPLSGGTEEETDARLRQRILNTLRNRPAGGNRGYIRQIILDKFGATQDVYVFSALGGPASVKVVPIKDFDPSIGDFSRTLSAAALQVIRGELQASLPVGVQTIVQASADQAASFTLRVQIPASSLSGGNGSGWTDSYPWPALETADAGKVTVTTATSDRVIRVSANTATPPVETQTNIAWWSTVDRKFYTALVIDATGSAGAWDLTLDKPFRGRNGLSVQVGDYISPAAQNLNKYGESWITLFRALGPGENTADADRLPRSLRWPSVNDEDRSSVTTTALTSMVSRHPEITDISFGSAPTTTPTVPGSVDTAPNVLVPSKFAVYPI